MRSKRLLSTLVFLSAVSHVELWLRSIYSLYA